MLTLGCWLSSPFALRCVNSGWPSSKDRQGNPLEKAVVEEAGNRARNLLSGLLRYVDVPYARQVAEPPAVWRKGNARLLDYGASPSASDVARPVVLFIPSLINRYYILDLEEERSLLRFLARQGHYPLVLDWGAPGESEKDFGAEEYLTQILLPVIEFLAHAAGRPITLVGYCMGGVLALAAAQLAKHRVGALALLATPWDFHCKEFKPFVVEERWLPMIESLIAQRGTLPADVIQSLFYMTDPWVFEQKFRRFAGMAEGGREAQDFVALERWVNDGVPMTANVARDCLIGWAQQNHLAIGGWQLAGENINPKIIKVPTFIAIPKNDHVVPTDCAMPLAAAMPEAEVIHPSSGHVGMIVGRRAEKELWRPLAEWIVRTS